MTLFLTIAFLLVSTFDSDYSAAFANTMHGQSQDKLYLIERIYVGEMGQTDEAARFRLLLKERLARKGFTVVERAESAEAIMTGVLSVRVLDEGSEARVYVTLKTPAGERLWGRDFGNGIFKHLLSFKEPVRLRAEDVARALRDDWKKSAQQ
jgi:hypothetical protein